MQRRPQLPQLLFSFCVCSTLLCACLPSIAQQPLRAAVTEEVVVTATRFSEPQDALPVGVVVVTAEELRRSTAQTLPEFLARFAGIHVRDNTGGPDSQVDMRGFGITGDQNTLILLDGQRLSEIELVSAKWSAIPLNAVERIEIMRGSGSVLYGSGATGGTINIITRTARPGEKTALLYGAAGSYDSRELRGSASLAGERAGIALSANQLESDNYRDNNHLRQRNADVGMRWGDAARSLSFKLSVDEQNLRNPGVRTAAQLETDRRGATTPADFSIRRGGRANLGFNTLLGDAEFGVNLTYRSRDAKATQLFFGATTELKTQVATWSLTPRLRVPLPIAGKPGALVLGLDVEEWDYDSVFQGGFFNSHALASQRNRAGYLQYGIELTPDTRLTLGGRIQRTENSITELLPVPATVNQVRTPHAHELALRHRVMPGFSVFGKMGRSFRIATVDENRFQVTLLEPQTSRDREIGAEAQWGIARMRLAAYRMDLENEIYFSPIFPPFGANINLSPTRREGVELETHWQLSPTLTAFLNAAVTKAKFREGSYGGINVSGNDVPLVPTHVIAAGGTWRFAPHTDLSAFMRAVGPQRFDNDQANTFAQRIPSYATLDLKLAHEIGGWQLAVTVRNLFDRKYFSYGIANAAGTTFNAYPAAERNAFVSAEYRFR